MYHFIWRLKGDSYGAKWYLLKLSDTADDLLFMSPIKGEVLVNSIAFEKIGC